MRAAVRALAHRAREGWDATGARFPIVTASWLVRCEYLVTVREIGAAGPVPPRPGVRWDRIEDPTQLFLVHGPGLGEREEIRRRLDEGQECWVAWIGGQAAHWRWETSRPAFLPYLGRWLRPQPGDLAVVDVYTAPPYRGRGLHTAGTLLALERARAQGFTRLVGLVAWWNGPARHVMEVKTARMVVGSVGYWRLGAGRRFFARGRVRLEGEGLVVPTGDALRAAGAAAGLRSAGA